MSINRRKFIEEYLKIVDKENNLVNLKFNFAQKKLYETIGLLHSQNKPIRIIVLKARQLGISTITEGIFFANTILKHNQRTGIITHSSDATSNLFTMCKTMYDNLPEPLKPKIEKDNQNIFEFNDKEGKGLNSKIKCMTAGSGGVGRSTTYNQLHISEYAFWPGDKKTTLLGLLQTVPNNSNSIVIMESTPNGFEDFKDRWDDAVSGKSDFTPLFFAWFDNPEYRMAYDGFELDADELELKVLYGLDNEQIAWRRWCIKNNCQNDIEQFKQEYPSNPNEAFISSGSCVFDKVKIINRLEQIKPPIKQGYFEYEYDEKTILNYKFVESNSKNWVKIYEEPKKGYPYVLGGDTAGIGSDSNVGDITNNITANQAATLEIEQDETEFTKQMFCLGKMYNYALMNIETNFSSYPAKRNFEMGYTNQFIREIDEKLQIKRQDKLGWVTSSATRPVMIAELKEFIDNDIDKINDRKTLEQCLTFVKRRDGKQAAEDGYHDDFVMAKAISLKGRSQQTYLITKEVDDSKINLPFALQDDTDSNNLYVNDDGLGLEW